MESDPEPVRVEPLPAGGSLDQATESLIDGELDFSEPMPGGALQTNRY